VIPSLAVLFLLIPLVGIGKIPALIALTLLALPPILINTVLGFSELSPALLEVSLGLGMNSSQLLWRIQLPLALPYILTGIKLALVELIASTTLAAYIGAGGLGNLIITGLGLARMDLLVIGGGSVALLSLVMMLSLDGLIKGVQNLVEEVHISLEEALRMATSYPAEAVAIDEEYGFIKEGYFADLTYFDENFNVKGTISRGKLTRY